jgi:hypothetical protein
MMKKRTLFSSLKMTLTAAAVVASVLALVGVIGLGQPAYAQPTEQALCEGSGGTYSGGACTGGDRTVVGTLRQVGNMLIFLIGAIAVLMIIIAGLRYVLSGGDQNAITSAKNTIIYALIGIIVAFMAYAIVNFVLDSLNIK